MKNLRFKLFFLYVMGVITLEALATPARDYLCFTANTVNSTVELVKNGDAYDVILQYSTDDCESWQTVDFSTSTTTGTIMLGEANDKVYFRNIRQASDVSGFSKDYADGYNHYQFKMSGSIAASGNVMSLVDSDVETKKIPAEYCFCRLFEDCKALTSAPELPADILKDNCYDSMFIWCRNLTSAPELPAMNLAKYCYESIFYGCTSLKKAPALPATNLKSYCYYRMFKGCTSLTEAPALNAKNLADCCYEGMFQGCQNLNHVKVAFTEWTDYATYNWLEDVASTGTLVCPDALDKTQTGVSNIPAGWTAVLEVKANKDPESENYYSTFYSGRNAYQVSGDMIAYTAVAQNGILLLSPVANGIIPADEAVILKGAQPDSYLSYTTDAGTKSKDNQLSGTDNEMTLSANQYALSLGQNGVGFYNWSGRTIGANKAFLTLSGSQLASGRSFGMVFDDGTVTGIPATILDQPQDDIIYNLQGQRVDESCKGLIIKNGRKVYNY